MTKETLELTAAPIVETWTIADDANCTATELHRAIIRGFADNDMAITDKVFKPSHFQKTFTYKDHGEFFRGVAINASLPYAENFYSQLKTYGTIKVTVRKIVEAVK